MWLNPLTSLSCGLGETFSETPSIFEDTKLETFTILPSLFAINPSCFNKRWSWCCLHSFLSHWNSFSILWNNLFSLVHTLINQRVGCWHIPYSNINILFLIKQDLDIWFEESWCFKKKRFYLFIFREKRRGEKERERNINRLPLRCTLIRTEPTTQACALTRNRTQDPSLCGTMPNQLRHTGQGQSWWCLTYETIHIFISSHFFCSFYKVKVCAQLVPHPYSSLDIATWVSYFLRKRCQRVSEGLEVYSGKSYFDLSVSRWPLLSAMMTCPHLALSIVKFGNKQMYKN